MLAALAGTEPAAAPACTDVPAPEPVEPYLLPTAAGSGRHSVDRARGFTDDYLWGPNDHVKIGIRRQWGGSVVFFGLAAGAPRTNVIDASDTGREVQMALYDPDRMHQGCAHDATCRGGPATQCPNSIKFLGWNPVQGGNKCNAGSSVERVSVKDGMIELTVSPLHWNPGWRETSCADTACARAAGSFPASGVRLRQRLRFVADLVAEMELEAINLGDDAHAPTAQEFPTLYAANGARGTPNLNVLLGSDGQRVSIDRPANDGFFEKIFTSPGGWATLQNAAQDYGVGIYPENRLQRWQGWQKAGVFNNVRAQFQFGLPAHGVVRARSYLMIGGWATIAQLARRLEHALPPFGALERPAPDEAVAGHEVAVAGWALDNTGVRQVEVLIDGKIAGTLMPGRSSPEICRAWPGYAHCGRAGFAGTVSIAHLGFCGHLLETVAVDFDGNRRSIGRLRFFARPVPR